MRQVQPFRMVRVAMAALVALLASLVTVVAFAPVASAATTFTNSAGMTINSPAYSTNETPQPASLYPSSINVSGQTGTLSHLTVTLNNVSHSSSDDMDVLLVGPNNQAFVLVSDAGSNQGGFGPYGTSHSTVTFDDNASSTIAQVNAAWGPANGSATVKPVDYNAGTDSWPSPAPTAAATPRTSPAPTGSGTLDGVFGGANPNGTWSLYVVDDTDGANGSIAGGWSLNLTTASAAVPTTTSVSSSSNPSRTGDNVTFTAQVTKSGGTPTGTVTFKEGATTLATSPVNGSGAASFSTTSLAEGQHTITAVYGGDPTSATSSGSVTQTVDNNTVASGGSYCNPGAVTLNDSGLVGQLGVASPYPSRIFASGIGGAISNVTLTLKNLTEPNLEDLDLLLVGPGGQRFLVVSDAGGDSTHSGSASNSTVTFDDNASFLPLKTSGGWGTSAQPVDYTDTTDSFPSPAPSTWSSPQPTGAATFASVFGGTDPNGTWSLYAVDDSADAGNGGSIAGGWCLNITSNSDAPTTTTAVSSSNPSTTGSPVTFTAHVTKNADNSDVPAGTVTFRDGGTPIGSPVALDANGNAAVTTSSLSEGSHTITAAYGGSPGQFNISSGQLVQQVDSPTVVTGTTYCNNGGITVRDPSALGGTGTASPYPSRISVSNLTGSGAKLSVALNGVTHAAVGDLDVLLVGPDGNALKLVSDAGGNNAVSNVTANFDDSATTTLPQNAAWGPANSAVTNKPTDYNDGVDTFPGPAPSPSVTTLNALGSSGVNGVWSLYVVDDTLGQTGSIHSWCLSVTVPPSASPDVYTAQQDTPLNVPAPGVLQNDTGSPLAATPISGGATTHGGTVDLSANGAFTYTPPSGYTGDDSFTYNATNSAGSSPATVTLHVHAGPTVTGSSIDRQQGTPVANSQIATVSEAGTPPGDLTVTAGSEPGVPVTNIVNTNGSVTADVLATCTATTGPHSIPLTATDGDHFTGSGNLTVNVTPDSAPVLTYSSVVVDQGGSTTADPSTGPTDNGSVAGMSIESIPSAFTGNVTVDGPASATPGRVHIDGAAPPGDYTVTVRATDNCGLTTDAPLTLHVHGAPTVDAGPDQTITLPATANLNGTVTDDGRSTPPTSTWSQVSGPGTATFGDASATDTTASFDQPGTYVLRLTATSGSLSQSDDVTVTVQTSPHVTVPADFSVTEDPAGSGTASVPFTVTATGSPDPTVTCRIGATEVSSPVTLAVGSHTIDCTATNAAGTDNGSFVVTVNPANRPPTADAGHPYSVAEGGSLTLDGTGSTDPDGDSLTYTWDVNGDGTYGDATGAQPVLTWSQLNALGINDGPASNNVRVQVSDGHNPASVSSPVTLTVNNAVPVASLGGASSGTVGAPTSLTLSATDASSVDQAAGFDYSINWGDGTTEGPIHSGSPVNRSHTYGHAGSYTVSLTATDKDGGTSAAATRSVVVSGAETVPDPVVSSSHALLVTGTPGNDTILIRPGSSNNKVIVVLNGTTLPQSSKVSRVIVNALGGNDTVTVDSRVVLPQLLYGGAGNDRLSTGGGPAVLVGGEGTDTLTGGNVRNVFIGGNGADTMTGGSVQDLLITGPTVYDAPDAVHERSLALIQAEWIWPTDQATRIGHLTGRTSGGVNGANRLTTTGAGRTVLNDTSVDVAHGLGSQDWFLMNYTGGGAVDTSDRTASETRTDL